MHGVWKTNFMLTPFLVKPEELNLFKTLFLVIELRRKLCLIGEFLYFVFIQKSVIQAHHGLARWLKGIHS